MEQATGSLAFFGPLEAGAMNDLERDLLARSGGEILLLPTGAAYERPERVLEAAAAHFEVGGAKTRPLMLLNRRDAERDDFALELSNAGMVCLLGNSPLHLRSVLKDSAALAALVTAWHAGATITGASAGATVLCDPMVDPRGGAFTVGLGLVRDVSVVTDYDGEMTPGLKRTLALAPKGCPVVALRPGGGVVRERDGSWSATGGDVTVFLDGAASGLEALAGKPLW